MCRQRFTLSAGALCVVTCMSWTLSSVYFVQLTETPGYCVLLSDGELIFGMSLSNRHCFGGERTISRASRPSVTLVPWFARAPMYLMLGIPMWMLAVGALLLLPLARRLDRCGSEAGCCVKCGYNLTGNVSGYCPECGVCLPQQSKSL